MPNITTPHLNNRFIVRIDDLEELNFSEVSSISDSTATRVIKEIDKPFSTMKVPGKQSFGRVTLTRAFTSSTGILEWRKEVLAIDQQFGDDTRRNVIIQVLDGKKDVIKTLTLKGAWPAKITIGGLSGASANILLEKVELEFDSLDIKLGASASANTTPVGTSSIKSS